MKNELENVFVKHYAPTICLFIKMIGTSSKFYGIGPKVDQVIYTFNTNCISELKWLPSYFVHKVALLYKMPKSEKRANSAKYLQNFNKM